ncbi:hypothetical protein M0R04_11490 [Candidatus Dojkabacteria bacterium]|jgi:hypothetical protein|nr:hypothetical protein [Candidatus Dojkabacteria bacterium]
MAANTSPIYSLVGNITVGKTVATANTAKDGTGTVLTIFTAGANGSRVEKVRFKALGTNVATVARIFINNGSDPTTATNNILYADITLAATTNSEVAALATNDVLLDLVLPPFYKLTVTIGTTVSAGYAVVAIAGDY